MSLSKREITSQIVRSLPIKLSQKKNIAFQPYFDYFIDGLLVEGTPYKDTAYIRRLVVPLFFGRDFVNLNYSRRLSNAGSKNSDLFRGSTADIVAAFVQSASDLRLTDDLSEPYSVSRFLKTFYTPFSPTFNISWAFDFGCAWAIEGNLELAKLWLDSVRERELRRRPIRDDESRESRRRLLETEETLAALAESYDGVVASVRERCWSNAKRLGF